VALTLRPGEAIFATVDGASLIEERSGGGRWVGRSSGVSVPIGLGVRYRVGSSRGHYVKAAPVPTAIDRGAITVTNQRLVFRGARQARECLFAKMLGYDYARDRGGITIGVSNRQKPTTLRYGRSLGGWFAFRFELALAHFRGTVARMVEDLAGELATMEASKPAPPPRRVQPPRALPPVVPPPPPAPPVYSPDGRWYWDGREWHQAGPRPLDD
jgi:hypothetical protein